jgi:dTDP-4-dehydrorhamnose 3,5-epimerase
VHRFLERTARPAELRRAPRELVVVALLLVPSIVESKVIADVVVVEPDVHGDDRGRFIETYRRTWFPLGREMIQGNRSEKQAGAVVGLHYHLHQADYWYVLRGTARVVLHDLREGSPTEGATLAVDLDGNFDSGLFIPPGVAHGFASLTDVLLWYLVDGYYNPADELGVAWDDPEIAADWGLSDPVLSERDKKNPRRADIDSSIRPRYGLRT